jgi:trk system potassium uptake protein TrkA
MFVMIIGGGRAGSHLATLLLELGHKVRLIEDRPQVVEQLHRELPTEVIHVGNALDIHVLEQAGIHQAQVLVAATDDDGINLSVAFLGKFEFEVPRIIGRVNDSRDRRGRILGSNRHLGSIDRRTDVPGRHDAIDQAPSREVLAG